MSLAALLALLLYWGVAALAAVLYLRRGAATSPDRALRIAALQLIVPATLFAVLTTALLLPNVTEALLGHDPHHPTGAELSLHGLAGGTVQGITLALLAGLVLWAWLPPLVSWARFTVLVRHLLRVSERCRVHDLVAPHRHSLLRDREVIVVPGAWIGLVGVLRPTLVVGEELLTGLREPELAAALAHEEAHERSGHPRSRLLLLIVSRMLPVLGRRLMGRWTNAAESYCDQSAARVVREPAWVASALLATQRLQQAWANALPRLQEGPVALGFASPDILTQRVERLLDLPETEPATMSAPTWRTWLLLAAVSLFVILMHAPLHHAVERLLNTIY